MASVHVEIPDQQDFIIEFLQENMPGVALVNKALKRFEPKSVFAWHLSIMIELEDVVENGMPSKLEQQVLEDFGDLLDENIKGTDKRKPNALFFARVTWNNTRELIWRVHDPEVTNKYLESIINTPVPPRSFDYRIDHDESWKLAEWYLDGITPV